MIGNKDFWTAQDVAEYLQISEAKAYVLIRELNAELQAKGSLTMRGRVSSKYLFERYGVEGVDNGEKK